MFENIFVTIVVIGAIFSLIKNDTMKEPHFRANYIELGKPAQSMLVILKDNEVITKKNKRDKVNIFNLPLSEISEFDLKHKIIIEDKTTEKDKSIVGRAVVGGLLLGPVGAIVGGMTGIGTKKYIKKVLLLSMPISK